MGRTTVQIFVGQLGVDSLEFSVHKELLCRASPYFNRIFNGKNKFVRSVVLSGHDSRSFDVFLTWLYHGQSKSSMPPYGDQQFGWCVPAVYSLAEKLEMPRMKDNVLGHYIDYLQQRNKGPTLPSIAEAYVRTFAGSLLRRFSSYFIGYIISNNSAEFEDESVCGVLRGRPDLNDDVIKLLRKYKGKVPDPRFKPQCYFHVHDAAETCPHT